MLKSFREDASRFGTLKAVQSLFWWSLHSRLRVDVYKIFLRPIEYSPNIDIEAQSNYEIKLLDPQTLRDACKDPQLDISTELAETAIAHGDVVVGAFKNDRLVTYTFATSVSAPHDDYFSVQVPPKMRYGYKGYTLPEHRGQHLIHLVSHLPERNKVFIQRGCTHHLSFIGAWNLSSLQSSKRTTTNKRIGFAINAYWGNRPISLLTPRVKQSGFRFLLRDSNKTRPLSKKVT